MKVLDAEFVQGFIRMANDGWEQGWHERNGGKSFLSYPAGRSGSRKWKILSQKSGSQLEQAFQKLAKEYFLVTGSGKVFP